MNRFIWLIRREIWEHKAIWVAPLVVLGCLVLALLTGNVHLGPIGTVDGNTTFGAFPADVQLKLLMSPGGFVQDLQVGQCQVLNRDEASMERRVLSQDRQYCHIEEARF